MKSIRTGLLCLLLLYATLPTTSATAQSATPTVENVSIAYQFGEQVTFNGRITSPENVTETLLFFRAQGEPATRAARVKLEPDGRFSYRYDVTQTPLRAFAHVDFWFSVTQRNGASVNSPQFFFDYLDNRFPWQETTSDTLTLHWYAGDAAFGQQLADTARNGQTRIYDLLGARPTQPIHLYVYASATDLQSALSLGGQAWVAGHASPDLGVGIVSLAPGPEQGLQMDRQIPHELAHLVLYQFSGERYALLPVWLKEGLASAVELSPNPDYEQALKMAAQNGGLLPISSLCAAFPPDASSRFLAYAQSASFTRALVAQYGVSGISSLISAYGDGLDCEQGAQRALGAPLSQIEQGWRSATLGENRLGLALQNLAGYLLLFALILLPMLWRRLLP